MAQYLIILFAINMFLIKNDNYIVNIDNVQLSAKLYQRAKCILQIPYSF
jgi:hypothetical protein